MTDNAIIFILFAKSGNKDVPKKKKKGFDFKKVAAALLSHFGFQSLFLSCVGCIGLEKRSNKPRFLNPPFEVGGTKTKPWLRQ
mmetsp:Transcript_17812/g.27508  ORF Transcript_17812/g.27508 Transcript_17812/m.27508 type:complete len:83 (+) Transcript_17812:1185-1433(+)